jgi:hypothetical protein
VVICMWTAPLNVVRFDATTLWHFDAAERAPSTTSRTDTAAAICGVRYTDTKGRRVRVLHPAPFFVDGQREMVWDDIRTASRPHMQLSFQNRRQGIVGDCRQFKIDVDSYNEGIPIRMASGLSSILRTTWPSWRLPIRRHSLSSPARLGELTASRAARAQPAGPSFAAWGTALSACGDFPFGS